MTYTTHPNYPDPASAPSVPSPGARTTDSHQNAYQHHSTMSTAAVPNSSLHLAPMLGIGSSSTRSEWVCHTPLTMQPSPWDQRNRQPAYNPRLASSSAQSVPSCSSSTRFKGPPTSTTPSSTTTSPRRSLTRSPSRSKALPNQYDDAGRFEQFHGPVYVHKSPENLSIAEKQADILERIRALEIGPAQSPANPPRVSNPLTSSSSSSASSQTRKRGDPAPITCPQHCVFCCSIRAPVYFGAITHKTNERLKPKNRSKMLSMYIRYARVVPSRRLPRHDGAEGGELPSYEFVPVGDLGEVFVPSDEINKPYLPVYPTSSAQARQQYDQPSKGVSYTEDGEEAQSFTHAYDIPIPSTRRSDIDQSKRPDSLLYPTSSMYTQPTRLLPPTVLLQQQQHSSHNRIALPINPAPFSSTSGQETAPTMKLPAGPKREFKLHPQQREFSCRIGDIVPIGPFCIPCGAKWGLYARVRENGIVLDYSRIRDGEGGRWWCCPCKIVWQIGKIRCSGCGLGPMDDFSAYNSNGNGIIWE